jgi:hypothetical protein
MLFIGIHSFTPVSWVVSHNAPMKLYDLGNESASSDERRLKHLKSGGKPVPGTDCPHDEPEKPLINEIIDHVIRVTLNEI